jgi:FkbM family methyltransferase
MDHEDAWAAFRKRQLAVDEASWPENTRKMLYSDREEFAVVRGAYRQCALKGEWDYISLFVQPDAACIDVGANMGLYSLKLANLTRRVLSIEPLKAYSFLANLLPANCIFRNVAAGERHQTTMLRIPTAPDGSTQYGLSSLDPTNDLMGYPYREEPVDVWPLDEIVAEALPDESIGFIKIDVESYELKVLAGARETLTRHLPNLQIEIDPANLGAACGWLGDLGYRGLFFFAGRLYDVAQFRPEIHCAPENAWTPERHQKFDDALYVSNFFFVPTR